MGLSGDQSNNPGYQEAENYALDTNTNAVPDSFSYEKQMGIDAYAIKKIVELETDNARLPTQDQKDALDASTTPSSLNAFATIEDLAGLSSPTSMVYDFNNTAGVPASGYVRLDNADPSLATVMRIHNVNREGTNMGNILLKTNNQDAIVIQEIVDGDKSYNFDVTGLPTQVGGAGASGYVEVPVSLFSQGATAIANDDICVTAIFQDGSNSAFLQVNNNLSDLNNVTTARTNLGVDSSSEVDTKITNANNAQVIGTTQISDGAITEAKIGTGAVTEGKIGTGAITADKIGTNAVTSDKVNSGAVTEAKIGTGAVTEAKIGTSAVTNVKIATGIDGAKLSSGTVTSDALAPGVGGAQKIYVSVAGSGDNSGSDASNRMPQATLATTLQGTDGAKYYLVMAAGTYTNNPLSNITSLDLDIEIETGTVSVQSISGTNGCSFNFFGVGTLSSVAFSPSRSVVRISCDLDLPSNATPNRCDIYVGGTFTWDASLTLSGCTFRSGTLTSTDSTGATLIIRSSQVYISGNVDVGSTGGTMTIEDCSSVEIAGNAGVSTSGGICTVDTGSMLRVEDLNFNTTMNNDYEARIFYTTNSGSAITSTNGATSYAV